MAISSLDIKFYYPVVTGYSSSSGGTMSNNSFDPSLTGAVIPPLTVAQAQAGGDFYTKFYVSLENSDNTPMYETYVFLSGYDPNIDSFLYRLGTRTDITTDAQSYTDWKCGFVVTSSILSAGATSISVELESADIFLNTVEYIWISDGVNSELVEIDIANTTGITNGVPDSTSLSLTISANYNNGNGLLYTYDTANCKGGFALSVGILSAEVANLTITGTVTMSNDISVYNNGTLNESFVLEFTGATSFKIRDGVDATKYYASDGTITDSTGAATFDTAFSDVNLPNPYRVGTYRFTIPQDTFASATAGDTITFDTLGANIPIWIKRVVPANTPSAIENIEFYLIGQGL